MCHRHDVNDYARTVYVNDHVADRAGRTYESRHMFTFSDLGMLLSELTNNRLSE